MTVPQPIPTTYAGYRFRSRLEARWAVFFDALGLRYLYEPEGFQIGSVRYLPDFHFPTWDCFCEVKPTSQISSHDFEKMTALGATRQVLVLSGNPWPWEYETWLVGPKLPFWVPLPSGQFAICTQCHAPHFVISSLDGERRMLLFFPVKDCCPEAPSEWCRPKPAVPSPRVLANAYAAARGARFEHGETPAPPKAETLVDKLNQQFAPLGNRPPGSQCSAYLPGQIVEHESYGRGTVSEVEDRPGVGRVVKVRFVEQGEKTFLAEKVRLRLLS